MRVRPIFWLVLFVSCASVLILASTLHIPDVPAILQVHLDAAQPSAHGTTVVKVHFTDVQGQPIEQASISSTVNMTNMDMGTHQSHFVEAGQGDYVTHLRFAMSGPWAIAVMAHANGFAPSQQVVHIQVV